MARVKALEGQPLRLEWPEMFLVPQLALPGSPRGVADELLLRESISCYN